MAASRPTIDLVSLLLSPSGEIGRLAFSVGAAVLALVALASDRVLTNAIQGAGMPGFLFALLVAWSAGCLSRKRLHDMRRSGILIAMFLAAYILAVLTAPFLPAMPGREMLVRMLVAGPACGWVLVLALVPGAMRFRTASVASVAAA